MNLSTRPSAKIPNVGSPKQLGEILFDENGAGRRKKGKTGAYATGADVARKIWQTEHEPCPHVLLELAATVEAEISTYHRRLQDPSTLTRRVHTSYSIGAIDGPAGVTDPKLAKTYRSDPKKAAASGEAFVAEQR